MPLENPDQQHVRSAHGYIALGMFEDANAELEEIDPFCRHLPEVLTARVIIYRELKKWDLMVAVRRFSIIMTPTLLGLGIVGMATRQYRLDKTHSFCG